jgi:hypothetical protein
MVREHLEGDLRQNFASQVYNPFPLGTHKNNESMSLEDLSMFRFVRSTVFRAIEEGKRLNLGWQMQKF